MSREPLVLALDTASPVVSVAVCGTGAGGREHHAERSVEISRSSRRLLEMVDEVLDETGLALTEVTGVVALRGPGSFTGLRVGLATVMGIHQALGTPATAISTLEVLAATVGDPAGDRAQDGEGPRKNRVVAAVDVLRGEWAAQPYTAGWPPRPESEAQRLPAEEMAAWLPCAFVGFGLDKLREELHEKTGLVAEGEVAFLDPPALAPVAARLVCEHPPIWDPDLLRHPLYFRPPPVTLPKRRPGTPRDRRRAEPPSPGSR